MQTPEELVRELDARRTQEQRKRAAEEARTQLDAGATGEDAAIARETLRLRRGDGSV